MLKRKKKELKSCLFIFRERLILVTASANQTLPAAFPMFYVGVKILETLCK